jgi:hypothetical protein
MKNYNSKNIDKVLQFITQANTSVESVNWLEKRVDKIIKELDKLDSDPLNKDEDKEAALIKELQVIVNRAQIEMKVIGDLENEMQTYLEEKKAKQTNPKKVSRKKSV